MMLLTSQPALTNMPHNTRVVVVVVIGIIVVLWVLALGRKK